MTANELTIHRPLDKDENNYTRSTTGLQPMRKPNTIQQAIKSPSITKCKLIKKNENCKDML